MPLSAVATLVSSAFAADLTPSAPPLSASSPWEGFYLGGHLGYAWGQSDWSTLGVAGSMSLAQTLDTYAEAGSFFEGIHGGYNYLLPNRVLIGVEADASFPAFPNLSGFGIGGASTFLSPFLGPEFYSDNVLAFGTVRGRIGYAAGDWLLYATGGFAWSRDQLSLTQISTGATDYPTLWRFGWAAGAGVEAPIAPHWTGRLEYLYTDYGATSPTFPAVGQQLNSNLTLHELRAGLTYHFDDAAQAAESDTSAAKPAADTTDSDRVNFHTQATFTAQGYPAIRSPYEGANSLLANGEAAETTDATLYAGLRLWQGAELWVNPEIDEGFGLGNTHGVAGFPSGESYKLGSSYPYARVQRYFIRQTIDIGGDSQKVDADINQFAGTQTADRLVLTFGKFGIPDIFDTNKYANNPKIDFLNWSLINAGTFDYAGDAWGYTYGGAAELYVDRFTFRGGVFDLSQTPAGGGDNAPAYGLDPTFRQVQLVGEIEERHTLWDQPGKIKVTAFLSRGNAGSFQDAINLSQATGLDASDALAAVRHYQNRPGVSVNLEQQVSDTVGIFARAGWADGSVEPWDFTDIDRTLAGGISLNGQQWGRPDDTWGIAGVLNGISAVHAAYFQNGGLGILIGDGQLPNVTIEKIFETYYSASLTPALKLSFDYQFIGAPAYNPQRGPVSVGAVRLHVQF
ncbi:MAG TPA: carbohydrate porin [Methylocella sp.]|nr:carbohydrate porin [Methylocella sp.]